MAVTALGGGSSSSPCPSTDCSSEGQSRFRNNESPHPRQHPLCKEKTRLFNRGHNPLSRKIKFLYKANRTFPLAT